MTQPFEILAMGNAILDVISPVEDSFLNQYKIPKGVMTLINENQAKTLHNMLPDPVECSGGSAANTLAGLSNLGSKTVFIGKLAQDKAGESFARQLKEKGIAFPVSLQKTGDTGRCLICVTPDSERSMNTFLGVAGEVHASDISEQLVKHTQLIYFEGYLFYSACALKAIHHTALLAKKHKKTCVLSLSDPVCVQNNKAQLLTFIRQYTDVLFSNEEEILSLFNTDSFDNACEEIKTLCKLIIITRGKKGAVIFYPPHHKKDRLDIPAERVEHCVDLTGAGDQFAAGFLYAYIRNYPLEKCGQLGAIAASEVISHYGARPEMNLKTYAENKSFEFKTHIKPSGESFFFYQTA